MPQEHHAGYEGIVTTKASDGIATIDWNIHEWELTEETKEAMVTNTGDYNATRKRAYTRRKGTTSEATGSFKFFYDSTKDPFPVLRPGSILKDLKMLIDATPTTGDFWRFPEAYVRRMPIRQGGMEGVFEITVEFANQGPYDAPGEAPLV